MATLIGIDPELFLFDNKKGKFVSAIDKIGGTKEEPRPIGNGCFVQEDNLSVEFNTPATNNDNDFVRNINYVKSYLADFLPGIDCKAQATVLFDEEETQDPRAWIFGCDPDFDAYSNAENSKPKANNPQKRTAGGHIHFGYDNHDVQKNLEVIKLADLYLGIPSLFMDKDKERREMYGKAGAHRHKAYGVEYRTLSNFWVGHDELMKWAFEQAMRVVESLGTVQMTNAEHVMARHCINTGLEAPAMYLAKKYNLVVL